MTRVERDDTERRQLRMENERVLRTTSVPLTVVPDYVAVSRSSAGVRLAAALEHLSLASPIIVALSRGALTVATAIADRTKARLDLWAVEPVTTRDAIVIGAMGEDEEVVLDGLFGITNVSKAALDDAIATAQERLRALLTALDHDGRPPLEWRNSDVVLVADGLFSAASARVAIAAFRRRGPRRIVIASPITSRPVIAQLKRETDEVIGLVRATVAETCRYRDDFLASDLVALEVLRAPRSRLRAS